MGLSCCCAPAATQRRLTCPAATPFFPAPQVQTLRKYRRVFKLGDPPELVTKDELLPAVLRHWQNQVSARARLACLAQPARVLTRFGAQTVDEDETALAFAFALRKQATSGGASPGGTVKTFKPAVKPVAKGKFK